MKCNQCGNTLPDDSEFCQYCGTRIEKIVVISESAAAVLLREAVADRQNQPVPKSEITQAKKEKEPKKKYCSRCGGLIDHQSKQCTGCGRKYFKGIRLNKIAVAITVMSLVIAALIGLNVYQYWNNDRMNLELRKKNIRIENLELENKNLELDNENLEEEVEELKTQNHSQRTTLSYNEDSIERLEAQIDEYKPIVMFMKDYVRIIGNDGTDLYHKYGCPHMDLERGFMVLNIEAAKVRGFYECSYCRYSLD